MSTDNRTQINDCEANTGWTGDDTANPISDAGSFIEGSGALSTQLSNSDEHMYTTQDSVGAGTFNLDWSDSTLYMNVKDNLNTTYALGGTQFVISDGTDTIGYDVGGNDAVGMPYKFFYAANKLDVSVIVTTPGSFATYAGTEANLAQSASTGIGYASLHTAKAVGSIDNVIMDGFYYIANDSYALTINGGTIGTPETMADVAGDDETNGWGLVANPFGSQYIFFGPTEWGESAAAADHYFTASGEQWYWMGDNAGGHTVGATHFPFRVTANATDAGSFVIGSVAIVNTGTGSEFDCSNTDIDTLEIDTCSMSGLASFSSPSTGGTSRFCTNTIFSECGQITHNGASMNGCTVGGYEGTANTSAMIYNETANPNGVMDNITFTKGTAATHAIEFGLSSPTTMTLTGINFSGYNAANANNDSAIHVKRTSGTVDITVSGGSGIVSYRTDGATVNIISGAVDVTANAALKDGTAVENARVFLKASDGTGPFPFEDTVTIARATTTATVTHTAHGMATNDKIYLTGITDKTEDNYSVHQITVTDANTYTYTTTDSGSTSYTGTIKATFVALNGLTNASGILTLSRVYSSNQPVSGWTRKSTSSPFLQEGVLVGTVNSSTGFNGTAVMLADE